jgi:uncharacterized protein YbjT (DUF2867 family)
MKIFVTGASGFIGGSIAAAPMAAGHQVSGLARSEAVAAALAKISKRLTRSAAEIKAHGGRG